MSETRTDKEQMEEILRAGDIGHMAFVCDPPYVVPINYTYSRGRILMHCSLKGKKLDLVAANPNVCFEVSNQEGHPAPHAAEACDNPFKSVLCWGKARIIDDLEERAVILQEFQDRYDEPKGIRNPITPERVKGCGAIEIVVERMTGRSFSSEAKCRWEWEDE